MIVSRLAGGLGNQMFQYAAGLGLAHHRGTGFHLDITGFQTQHQRGESVRDFSLADFRISAQILNAASVKSIKNPYGIFSRISRQYIKRFVKNYYHDWHPEIFKTTGDVYLDGYFQTEKHFSHISSQIIGEFQLNDDLLSDLHDIQNWVRDSEIPTTSLHVRRGDYVHNSRISKYLNICTREYFHSAIKTIEQQAGPLKVVVFSDDLEWVKQHISLSQDTIYVSGQEGRSGKILTPSQEMAMMAMCDHNIISNSTFSWWGAYLNTNPKKIVVAPQPWTNNPRSRHRNIIPNEWNKIFL